MLTTRSRQFRNPRYAPEGLERRLSPSALGITVPAAAVSTMASDSGDGGIDNPTMPTDPDPAPGTLPPPQLPSNPPTGPVGPAD